MSALYLYLADRRPLHQSCSIATDALVGLFLLAAAALNGARSRHHVERTFIDHFTMLIQIVHDDRCVQALVEAGAQVDMQTKSDKGKNKGAVALHYAAQQNMPQVVEYLIRQRASVNRQDARGCTPLHYAAYTGLCDTAAGCLLCD